MPFVRVEVAQYANIAAVGEHGTEVEAAAGPDSAPDVPASSLGNEDHAPIGQEAGVKVVPGTVRQLNQVAAICADLKQMVTVVRRPLAPRRSGREYFFPALRCVLVARVGKQNRMTIVRDFWRQKGAGPQLLTFRSPVRNNCLLQQIHQSRMLSEWVFQHEQATSWHGREAIVLITDMRQATAMAFDEQQFGDVQQRISEGDLAQEPACFKINLLSLLTRHLVTGLQVAQPALAAGQVCCAFTEPSRIRLRRQAVGQRASAGEHFAAVRQLKVTTLWDPTRRGVAYRARIRVAADALLVRWLAQRDVLLWIARGVDLHFIQGEVADIADLQANDARSDRFPEPHDQRPVVLDAVKDISVVLVYGLERVQVVGARTSTQILRVRAA